MPTHRASTRSESNPQRRLPIALAIVALAVAASETLRCQELRTDDGRVFVGAMQRNVDGYTVTTDEGELLVADAEVLSYRSRPELSAELRRLAKAHGESAFARLELAHFARDWQLEAEMWDHLDACLAASPSGATARRLAGFFEQLSDFVVPPDLRSGEDTAHIVREVLRRMRVGERDARSIAIEYALANLQGDDVDRTLREQARRAGSPQRRLTALRALDLRSARATDSAANETPSLDANARFVLRTAILDSNADVRASVLDANVGARLGDDAVHYLAPGLASGDSKVQVRTADALGSLGRPAAALPYLVSAGVAAASGPLPAGSTRGHVAFLNQQSYIRDFDVEVAQAAFIADPQIDVLQSGVVLDATVHSVRTTRVTLVNAYRRALRALVGDDPGRDPSTWPYWLAAQQKLMEKASEAKLAEPKPGAAKAGAAERPERGSNRGNSGASPATSAAANPASCASDVVWTGTPTGRGPVIGSPIGGPAATPWPLRSQPSAGIQPYAIGVACPGQPAIAGGRAW